MKSCGNVLVTRTGKGGRGEGDGDETQHSFPNKTTPTMPTTPSLVHVNTSPHGTEVEKETG